MAMPCPKPNEEELNRFGRFLNLDVGIREALGIIRKSLFRLMLNTIFPLDFSKCHG